jgi:hypothetical protein
MPVTVRFQKDRDTKNTVRYAEIVEEGDPAVVGTLYLQKHAVKALDNPESLVVTIEGV